MSVAIMNTSKAWNDYLVQGVFLEVLWDIEHIKEDGRRVGERSVNSVWWRAEVMSTEYIDGKCKAEIRYDERDSFAQQEGQVWVFPGHVRSVDDDSTQLRWRFYECSGNVSYLSDGEADTVMYTKEAEAEASNSDKRDLKELQNKVGRLVCQYEELERMVVGQNQLYARMLGTGSTADRHCVRAFSALRQKLALLLQRPIPPVKKRQADDERNSFFEISCAGCINTEVDCDLDTFQSISRVVKSKVPTSSFRPSFMHTQCPPADIELSEIFFVSLADMAEVIGIKSASDLMCMAIRERAITGAGDRTRSDAALRILGTCVVDPEDEKSPTAMLTCQSMNDQFLSEDVEVLFRESREFDFVSRAYIHPLVKRKFTGYSLLNVVFASQLPNINEKEKASVVNDIARNLRCFCLRWQSMTAPNSRLWSRSLVGSEVVNGVLEVELQFTIFRGSEAIREISELDVSTVLNEAIRKQCDRYREE